MLLTIIGVDADDTLWHTETACRMTKKRFKESLDEFGDEKALDARQWRVGGDDPPQRRSVSH
jgi:putative hydrolase of the HAD superfamily